MSTQTTIEQRLAALEQDVSELKKRLEQAIPQRTWLERVAGSMKDYPEFGEILKLGAAIRQADRPVDGT